MTRQTVNWRDTQDPAGSSCQEFVIQRDGKRDVTGALWIPQENDSANTLVLFGHGASGDRYQAPICHMAKRFRDEAALPVLSMDGPVHGLRQTGPGGRESFWPEWQRAQSIDDMVEDWQCAITTCLAREDITTSQIAYFGLSMGSIFGIPIVAGRDDVAVATLGLLGTNATRLHGERLLSDAERIACPLLFLMQLEDELFLREDYLELFDRFASSDKRIHANPGLHPEIPAEEIDFAFDFMMQHIKGDVRRRIINPLAE